MVDRGNRRASRMGNVQISRIPLHLRQGFLRCLGPCCSSDLAPSHPTSLCSLNATGDVTKVEQPRFRKAAWWSGYYDDDARAGESLASSAEAAARGTSLVTLNGCGQMYPSTTRAAAQVGSGRCSSCSCCCFVAFAAVAHDA